MREHAGLGGDLVALPDLLDQGEQGVDVIQVVGGRVDADDRVAAAVEQPVHDARGDPARIVRRVVRLQTSGQVSRQADGVTESRHIVAASRDRDQVLIAHDLGDPGGHLGRDAGTHRGQYLRCRVFGE